MSGYLSLLRLNPDDPQVRSDLRSATEMHRSIMAAFPNANGGANAARARMGILFRVNDDPEEITVLVQSQEPPCWENLARRAPSGYLLEPARIGPLDQLLDRVAHGTTWRFRLLANATTAHGNQHHAVINEQDLVAWLTRRAEALGAHLATTTGAPTFTVQDAGAARGRRGPSRVVVRQTAFEGTLRVADPAALRQAVINGVGRARAYGCGLLSLLPA